MAPQLAYPPRINRRPKLGSQSLEDRNAPGSLLAMTGPAEIWGTPVMPLPDSESIEHSPSTPLPSLSVSELEPLNASASVETPATSMRGRGSRYDAEGTPAPASTARTLDEQFEELLRTANPGYTRPSDPSSPFHSLYSGSPDPGLGTSNAGFGQSIPQGNSDGNEGNAPGMATMGFQASPQFGAPGPITVEVAKNGTLNLTALMGDSAQAITDISTPEHGDISIVGGSYIYTPALDYLGGEAVEVTVGTGGGPETTTVAITVVEERQLEAVDDTAQASPGGSVAIALLSNDIAVSCTASLDEVGTPMFGEFDGDTYSAPEGYTGWDSFPYTITNEYGEYSSATVSVYVGEGSIPSGVLLAVDDYATMDVNGSVSIDISSNDINETGGWLADMDAPMFGTFSGGLYVPSTNFIGTDYFSYTLEDSEGQSSTAWVVIDVTAGQLEAVDDYATTTLDEPVAIDISSNDINETGGSISATTAPNNGVFSGGIYTPEEGFTGEDAFTYTLTDGYGQSSTAMVTIYVDPPEIGDLDALDDEYTMQAGGALTLDIETNDINETNGVWTQFSNPSHGTFVNSVYTPDEGFTGEDSFTYHLSDEYDQDDVATVTIYVDSSTGSGSVSILINQTRDLSDDVALIGRAVAVDVTYTPEDPEESAPRNERIRVLETNENGYMDSSLSTIVDDPEATSGGAKYVDLWLVPNVTQTIYVLGSLPSETSDDVILIALPYSEEDVPGEEGQYHYTSAEIDAEGALNNVKLILGTGYDQSTGTVDGNRVGKIYSDNTPQSYVGNGKSYYRITPRVHTDFFIQIQGGIIGKDKNGADKQIYVASTGQSMEAGKIDLWDGNSFISDKPIAIAESNFTLQSNDQKKVYVGFIRGAFKDANEAYLTKGGGGGNIQALPGQHAGKLKLAIYDQKKQGGEVARKGLGLFVRRLFRRTHSGSSDTQIQSTNGARGGEGS